MNFLKNILPIMKRNNQSLKRFFSTFQPCNFSTCALAAALAATSAAAAANFPQQSANTAVTRLKNGFCAKRSTICFRLKSCREICFL